MTEDPKARTAALLSGLNRLADAMAEAHDGEPERENRTIEGSCDIIVGGEIPEEVSLRFATNGAQGGDAGHGGCTILEIAWEGGSHVVEVDDAEGEGGSGRVRLIARGDWEMVGLAEALVALGDKLRPFLRPWRS